MAGLPRPLLRKRDELARELAILERQAHGLRDKLSTLDGAIRLLEPAWKPPKAIAKRRPQYRGRLPQGEAARASLRALKRAGRAMNTGELVAALEAERGLKFSSRKDREDFASSITMAMRRYEAKGLIAAELVGKGTALLWHLKRE